MGLVHATAAGDPALQRAFIKLLTTAPRGSPFDANEAEYWTAKLKHRFKCWPLEMLLEEHYFVDRKTALLRKNPGGDAIWGVDDVEAANKVGLSLDCAYLHRKSRQSHSLALGSVLYNSICV